MRPDPRFDSEADAPLRGQDDHREKGKFEFELNYLLNRFVGNLCSLFQVSNYVKAARVKQVLADLALSPVASKAVEELSQSEYRR